MNVLQTTACGLSGDNKKEDRLTAAPNL